MINGIVQHGKYMYIHGGYAGPGPYVNMSNSSAGMVRYDGANLQVYDGNTWMNIAGSSASVGINPVAEEAIDWVRQQMEKEKQLLEKEKQLLELAKKSKSVSIALDNLNNAKAELELIAILAREHNEETTT
jgi:hypothetical protein